jgi:hypothetical protein
MQKLLKKLRERAERAEAEVERLQTVRLWWPPHSRHTVY